MPKGKNIIADSLANDIAKHCSEFEKSPEYAEMIRTHVKSLYEKAIKDTFSWGNFPDRVKKALESALPENISEVVDLPKYNLLMAKELSSQWEMNGVSEQMVNGMKDLVLKFIKSHEIPKYIKASDLWKAYVDQYQEEAAHEGWGRPLVVISEGEYTWEKGFFHIGLEKEPASASPYSHRSKEKYHQCDTHLSFHQKTTREMREDVAVMHDGYPVYSLYAGELEYHDTLGKQVVQFRSEFERLVGALYYGGSLLVLDESDADEIYYNNDYS
ncbi:UNVERIFIED_ORG: hypothetical protein EC838_3501 [Providencia alcalifaciens]